MVVGPRRVPDLIHGLSNGTLEIYFVLAARRVCGICGDTTDWDDDLPRAYCSFCKTHEANHHEVCCREVLAEREDRLVAAAERYDDTALPDEG